MTDQKFIMYGAGEHGRVIYESLLGTIPESRLLGFVDDNPISSEVAGKPVFASLEDAIRAHGSDFHVCIGGGSVSARRAMVARLAPLGLALGTVVCPGATISPSSSIGKGTYIGHNTVVHTRATIGIGCIINTGAIVEHDCEIGDFTEISVGAVLGGGVKVGSGSFVAIGATVRDHVSIGPNTTIGAGGVVVSNIPANVVAYGVPARIVRGQE